MSRSKTNTLREILKGHAGKYKNWHVNDTTSDKLRQAYLNCNMRQLWQLAAIYIESLNMDIREPYSEPQHTLEFNLYWSGFYYYHARKYGMRSARLLKLNY